MTAMQALRTTMVDTQVRPSDVTKFPIIQAMLEVPREAFVPRGVRPVAYSDAPVPLGGGREMPEARVLAKMLDALDIQLSDQVLVIGGGMGYSTAVLARMADSVVMIEADAAVVAEAEAALAQAGVANAAVLEGTLATGAPQAAPFDVILIEGGVETIPDALCDQLVEGGRIVALVQDGRMGRARLGRRVEGRMAWRDVFDATAPVLPGFEAARGFTF